MVLVGFARRHHRRASGDAPDVVVVGQVHAGQAQRRRDARGVLGVRRGTIVSAPWLSGSGFEAVEQGGDDFDRSTCLHPIFWVWIREAFPAGNWCPFCL